MALEPDEDLLELRMLAILAGYVQGLEQGHAGFSLKGHERAKLNQVAAFGAAPPFEPFEAGLDQLGFGRLDFFGLGLQQPETGGLEFLLEGGLVLGDHEPRDGATSVINTAIAKDRHMFVLDELNR